MSTKTNTKNGQSEPEAGQKEAGDDYFSPPKGAIGWRCARAVGGQWEPLVYELPDGSAEVNEWPVRDLSVATLRERWGSGTYRVLWIGKRDGKRVGLGQARPITVKARTAFAAPEAAQGAAAAPQPASAGAAGVLDGFATFMHIMAAADARASQFYGAMMGMQERSQAMMFDFLRGAVSPQAIAAAVGPAVKQAVAEALPELEDEPDDDEPDDDEPEDDEPEPPPKNVKQAFARGVGKAMNNVAEVAPDVLKGAVELGKDAVDTWRKKTERANMSHEAGPTGGSDVGSG